MTKNETLLDLEIDRNVLADEDTLVIVADAIRTCLRESDKKTLRAFLDSQEPADIATILDTLEAGDALAAMRHVDLHEQAQIFGYLDPEYQIELSDLMGRREFARLMSAMSHDERVDLFKHLDPVAQEAVLPGLAKAERDDLRKLASYKEGTAGSIMTSDYATLTPEMTAKEAIEALRNQALDAETVYQAYIIDEDRKLVGVISLRDLIVARANARVRNLMDTNPVFIRAEEDREEAAQIISRYDLMALPVINGGDKLVGIVTQDDAMDVQEQEATSDFHKVGTVSGLKTGVRDAGIFVLYRARIVWLVLLVFGNIFSGAGIAYFEETIEAYVALVFFLPLLIDSGGNAGSQSATLMVRALATGDVRINDWAKMLGRELAIAALLGITMAVAVSTIGVVRGGPEIAVVVASSMMIIVVVGSMIGMSLPFLLSRFKLDPATASAPLVTSIADATGVLIYFAIATQVLHIPAS
ncbi:MAG: magnesium transporter [Salinarimonas sp.]